MMMMCRRRRQPAAAAPRSSSHTGLACCPFCFGRKCNTQQSPRENTRECWVVRVVLRAAVSRSVHLECPRVARLAARRSFAKIRPTDKGITFWRK